MLLVILSAEVYNSGRIATFILSKVRSWQCLEKISADNTTSEIKLSSIVLTHTTSNNESTSIITRKTASMRVQSMRISQLLRKLKAKTPSENYKIKPMTDEIINSKSLECPTSVESNMLFRKRLATKSSRARTEKCHVYFKMLYKAIYPNDHGESTLDKYV